MGSTIVWHKKYYTGSTEKKLKKKQSESIHEVQWYSIKKRNADEHSMSAMFAKIRPSEKTRRTPIKAKALNLWTLSKKLLL